MHRIFRHSVIGFSAITVAYLIFCLRDHGLLIGSAFHLSIAVTLLGSWFVQAGLYAFNRRRGVEPEPKTRDTVTGELITVLGMVAYQWLVLAVLVATGTVSHRFQMELQPIVAVVSAVVTAFSVIQWSLDRAALRRGRSNAHSGGRGGSHRAPHTERHEAIPHGRA